MTAQAIRSPVCISNRSRTALAAAAAAQHRTDV